MSQFEPSAEATLSVNSLCGRWEGKSTSRNNDPTYWKESVLEFKLLTATAGTIIGHGVSLWRNMHIEFDVRGTFDWETKEVKLIKQHKGVYSNTVQYAALVNHEDGTITGEYSNGVIDLKRCHASSDDPAELLSGTWVGESVRYVDDAWVLNTNNLSFQSVFLDYAFFFFLIYILFLSSISTSSFCFLFTLLIDYSRSNDPTTWTETSVAFTLGEDGRHGTISGQGTSLWRNMKIRFTVSGEFDWETLEVSLTKQHIGRYTNEVKYSGVILPDRCAIEGHYSNGSISLRKVAGSRMENGQVRNQEEQVEWEAKRDEYNREREETEKKARQRAEDTRLIEEQLGGVWEGTSQDKDDNITKWSDTALKFKLDPFEWIGKITGSGVSEWREKRIDFDIEGRYDWNTRKIDLVKQHKGQYTNRVKYTCTIKKENINEGKQGDDDDAKKTSSSGSDMGGKKKWVIRGVYSKGTIKLTKIRGFGGVVPRVLAGSGGSKNNDENNKYRNQKEGKTSNNGKTSVVNTSVLEKYETYLAGVIGDGSGLSSQDLMLLANFRNSLGLSEEDHITSLRNMKMTPAEFKSMCSSGEEKTDDICKICFVNDINSVILPCGHFSICVECGHRLQAHDAKPKCPICR